MNILICSAGRRVRLVQYFKEELQKINGRIIAVDCDVTAPALSYADSFEVVPRISHPNYIQHIKEICAKYDIKAILSLIDPELSLLARYKKEFKKEGITIVVSNKDVVDICFDKYSTYQFLKEHDIPSVKTYVEREKVMEDLMDGTLNFPLIIKPRNGSASLGISKVNTVKELEFFWNNNEELVVQPFINAEEYGVDCFIDLISGVTTNIFTKRKVAMRAGETDKSVAINDQELKQLIQKLISALKPAGPIDVDCFKTGEGFVVSEINPRFGGGYLHAHEMGQNFVENIINNLMGKLNSINEEPYGEGTILVKYDHFIILNSSQSEMSSVDNKLKLQLR
ncbi:ATP-grasp domain-containing protein [Lederbergia panacisoli]|uniref:ATP-grasp domain-containing protein n=1 Tax=Lederbergia panacisoli TaxID=1255251 RepID=UPI00214BEBB0|nr:ATP-grasp domain-containing protein [Lederbergia panacisoli]MCR2822003.1 ATP-grasp domain-containing protein [Lederbergia panacisoli]